MVFELKCGFRGRRLERRKRQNAGYLGHFRRLKKNGKLTARGRRLLEAHEIVSERLRA